MAIEYKQLKDKLEKAPLTHEELNLVQEVENFIDEEISRKFKGDSVYIELKIADFSRRPTFTVPNDNLAEARRILMRKELVSRYEKAGWKQEVRLDDGLDGPNRSGPDYWVLTGK
jgi:hypothetical protein